MRGWRGAASRSRREPVLRDVLQGSARHVPAAEAKKFYADSSGVEKETSLNDHIEIGLFTAHPARDKFDESHVILLERHLIRSGRQVLKFVTDKMPTYAGIDSYIYYIDRIPTDNVSSVSLNKSE